MTVTLPPQVEALIQEKVDSGLYPTADAVIEEAMRLLDEQDRIRWLQEAIAAGQRSGAIAMTPERMHATIQRGIADAAAGKPVKDAVAP